MVIVSGLARSGTSLMMKILKDSGYEVITDGKRKPDKSNPNGYLEHEEPYNLSANNKYCIKILSVFLEKVKDLKKHQIIYMIRDIDEIVISMTEMAPTVNKVGLRKSLLTHRDKTIEWLRKNHNVIFIDYNVLLKTVDPKLYRSKV